MTWTLARNPASQIVSDYRSADVVWTGHYAVNRAYTANGLNQYSAAGNATFGYDANGNLVSDGSRTYTYDVENRLVGASGGLALAYDPLGRLFQTSGGPSGTTRFLYDGDALVGEYDAAGNVLRRYAHGPGPDEPWLWYEGSQVSPATRRQLSADPQGSIAAIADGAGNRLAVNTYDEYGIPAAGNMGRFQYTGQIWLPDLGMYHYKARVYSPTLGRFLQTDPIGYDDQFNLYAYVGNDPVNASDPSGESGQRGCGSLLPQDSASCSGQTLVANAPPLIPRPPPPPGPVHHNWNSDEGNNDFLNTVLGCESAMTCAMSRDDRAVLSGRMAREEYTERAQARAGGVIAGASILVAVRSGGAAVTAGGAALARRMVLSNHWGVFSGRFGNRFFRGLFDRSRPGTLNQGATRLGWSYNARTGMLTFQPRIGGVHIPSPIRIRVPDAFR